MDTVLCVLLCCLVPRLGISQYLGRERESEFNRDQKNETKANDKETSKKKKLEIAVLLSVQSLPSLPFVSCSQVVYRSGQVALDIFEIHAVVRGLILSLHP